MKLPTKEEVISLFKEMMIQELTTMDITPFISYNENDSTTTLDLKFYYTMCNSHLTGEIFSKQMRDASNGKRD